MLPLARATLVVSALSLTACFTIIDFDLDDNAGGAPAAVATGTGGSLNGGEAAGGNSAGGQAAGGDGAGGSGPCPDCDGGACVSGVCQPVLLFEAEHRIATLAVGGPYVVVLEAPIPAAAGALKWIDTGADPVVVSPTYTTTGTWDNNGSLAVSEAGDAFYSSPFADGSLNPIQRCVIGVGCSNAFSVPDPQGLYFHLNGLREYGGFIHGLAPVTGRAWSALADGDVPASIDFLLSTDTGLTGVVAAHRIAMGGALVAATSFGEPDPSAPCVGIGNVGKLGAPEDDFIQCHPLPLEYGGVRSVSVTASEKVFVRAILDGDPLKGVTLKAMPGGSVHPPFAAFELPIASYNSSVGDVVADNDHVFFIARQNLDRSLFRCDTEGDGSSCLALATDSDLNNPGAMVANGTHIFFADGKKLFRLVK